MDAALIIKVNVLIRGHARLPGADAGVEVQPLPRGPPARDQSQHVDVDVVDATRGDDLGGLGPVLTVGASLPRKVVMSRARPRLALDHGRVVVQVLPDVGHDLASVSHVVVLGAGEVEAKASVVATAVASDVANVETGEFVGDARGQINAAS